MCGRGRSTGVGCVGAGFERWVLLSGLGSVVVESAALLVCSTSYADVGGHGEFAGSAGGGGLVSGVPSRSRVS